MDRSLQLRVLILNILSKFIKISFVDIVFEMITRITKVLVNKRKLSCVEPGSVVGIGIGYGLDSCGVEIRVPAGAIFFSTSRQPDRL
jgi:hypothetical protein